MLLQAKIGQRALSEPPGGHYPRTNDALPTEERDSFCPSDEKTICLERFDVRRHRSLFLT